MGNWVRVARADECATDGCIRGSTGNGESIVLVRSDGELFAMEDRCSHEDYPLSGGAVEDGTIECVLHGARFDLRSGRAVRLPAVRPVRTFPVEIRGDEIFVEID